MSENKKTIIIFSCFYEPFMSGAEKFVKEITERLSRPQRQSAFGGNGGQASGYRFVVISAKFDKNLPVKAEKNGIEIHRVGFGGKFDKWIYPVLAPFVALKYKPVLLHAVMESYAGIALWISAFLTRVPRILTLQSGDLDDATKQNKIPAWLWKRIHTTPNKITAISNFLKKRALKLGVPEERIEIVPNGVDFTEAKSIVAEKIPHRIICVGRLSWEKGHEYLFGAMPEILKSYPDARLVLAGAGPREGELKELADKTGIAKAIDFLGNLPHNEVISEIKKAEVFICPSLAEGLGIVFIEAQACGTPVIGTNVGGIPDVIENGKTGILVLPKDSSAITEAIKKIFEDKTFAEEIVKNANESVLKFDWEKITEQMDKIYQKMIF
jgi:glycosyltransferase involved in cell wall biosynthesis